MKVLDAVREETKHKTVILKQTY